MRGEKTGRKLRLGAVSYLNTKPLVYELQRLEPDVEIVFDLPSRLADDLASSALDIALIPSIEYFQAPDYTIVSDACIGCQGPVLSVKLVSRLPLHRIRTLALDEGSRTSVALVRILLRQRFDLSPRLIPFPIGRHIEEIDSDAILVIGDRAIHLAEDRFPFQWDLGDRWCRWSELPFVFAMWVAHRDTELNGLEKSLCEARDLGLAHLDQIARIEAQKVGLSELRCLSYLRDNLHFHLGPREQAGLELFYREAAELEMAPRGVRLSPVGPGRIGYEVS